MQQSGLMKGTCAKEMSQGARLNRGDLKSRRRRLGESDVSQGGEDLKNPKREGICTKGYKLGRGVARIVQRGKGILKYAEFFATSRSFTFKFVVVVS